MAICNSTDLLNLLHKVAPNFRTAFSNSHFLSSQPVHHDPDMSNTMIFIALYRNKN